MTVETSAETLEFKNKGSFDLLALYEDLVGAKPKFKQMNKTSSEYLSRAQVGGINLLDGEIWHVYGAVRVYLFANDGDVYEMQIGCEDSIPCPDGKSIMSSPAYLYIDKDGKISNPVEDIPLVKYNTPLGNNHIPIFRLLSNVRSYHKYRLNLKK
jgi:hypothetical protein